MQATNRVLRNMKRRLGELTIFREHMLANAGRYHDVLRAQTESIDYNLLESRREFAQAVFHLLSVSVFSAACRTVVDLGA